MTPHEQLAAKAFELHQAGRIVEAELLYRQALALQPTYADALHLLGVCEHQSGRNVEAIAHIRSAIGIDPAQSGYQSNLGAVLAAIGRFEEAAGAFSTAVQLNANAADAHNNLGNALRELNRLADAEASYRRAIAIRPDYPEAHYHLAGVLSALGQLDAAEAMYRRAIELRPRYPEAMNNLGTLLQDRGRYEESIRCFERAIAIRSTYVEAMSNLGNSLREVGRVPDAVTCFQRALSVRQDADVLNNLANAFREQHRLGEAESALLQALELRPKFAEALGTLSGVHKDAGRMEQAIACVNQSVVIKPSAQLAGNGLFLLHHLDGVSADRLVAEHAAWNDQYAKPLAPSAFSSVSRVAGQRLRVGYVSPDLSDHPVGRFILPLLENHDHTRFEIFCYTDTRKPDAVTERIKSCADAWRLTLGRTDLEAAEIIRGDRIDILIDLAMHTRHNRMMMFALKPAPVQATYLAYPSTTGLATMDYRVSDPYLDPPDRELGYCEKTVRLPNTYWCYAAPRHAPDVGSLPADRNGIITFGCLNQYAKVTPRARRAWRQLLRQIPKSRFLVHAGVGRHREDALREFTLEGLDPNRLQFVERVSQSQYFAQYNEIDIGLDTFPYPGGTTTCDALWMGVPVVSLPGALSISRGGLSVLSNVGLAKLAADSVERYIEIASDLASDIDRLRTLRAGMRPRMLASPLMDARQFARDFESMLESISIRA